MRMKVPWLAAGREIARDGAICQSRMRLGGEKRTPAGQGCQKNSMINPAMMPPRASTAIEMPRTFSQLMDLAFADFSSIHESHARWDLAPVR